MQFNIHDPALKNHRPSAYSTHIANARKAFETFKADRSAHNQNLCLAHLEVVTAMPPEWATLQEQKDVVAMIKEAYGDHLKFLFSLHADEISFCNKVGIDIGKIVIETRIAAFMVMNGIDDKGVEFLEITPEEMENL